jgi:hypothetical protein
MVEDLFFTACKDGDCKRVKELLKDCEDNARKAQVNDGFQWLFESFVSGCAEILPGHVAILDQVCSLVQVFQQYSVWLHSSLLCLSS